MIGQITLKISAHRPDVPLNPVFSFRSSPSSIRLMDIPKKIGQWDITRVYIKTLNPDNSTSVTDCLRSGSVWIGTFQGCDVVGKVADGIEIVADGTSEYGEAVEGYVLGVADYVVLDKVQDIDALIQKYNVRYLDELPVKASKGDLIVHNSTVMLFDGEKWITCSDKNEISAINSRIDGLGTEIEGVRNAIPTKTSQLDNDSGFITQEDVDPTKITSDDGLQYINGAGEVYAKNGVDYTPWVAKYSDGRVIDEMTFTHIGEIEGGSWIAYYRGATLTTDPAQIPGNAHALELRFRWNDDGQWFDVVATRSQVESEWMKTGDLALKGDIAGIDSKATSALNLVNNLSPRMDNAESDIQGLKNTKANVTETENIKTDLTQAFEYIAELQQEKITSPVSQMQAGKVLTVVEVQEPEAATFAIGSQRAATRLEWQAAEPFKVTKVSELENDSGYVNSSFVEGEIAKANTYTDGKIQTVNTRIDEAAASANTYTDGKIQAVNTRIDQETASLTQYVDNEIGNVLTQEEF